MSNPLRRGKRSRSPLAIAAFIAIPLFFSSLMAATLALEKPRLVQWTSGGRLLTTWHDPSPSTEARIWLWALVPPLVLILVGWIAIRLPHGFYVSCVTAIVIAMAVVHRLSIWTLHHTLRFPNGVDLIPKSNVASNRYDPGEWERMAHATALSLSHWTIAIAVVSIVVAATAAARRRYFARVPAELFAPVESIHAVDATMPGLGPDTAPALEVSDSELARRGRPERRRNR
ncbi:MAG TPA: hypothetical protein VEG24_01515 [Gaiellaceae bacterium]|nr:hypothetical protein [Gaiellaceae bacterium]